MNSESGKGVMAAIAAVVFLGAMLLISGGSLTPTLIAAAPIIGGAELMIFGMLYAIIFHSAGENH